MRIVFGICAWGLGHATRTLPIIRKAIKEGHNVSVVSSGRALSMLRQELGDGPDFFKLEDYQPPGTLNSSMMVLGSILRFPEYVRAIRCEHDFVKRFIWDRKVDVIFSDNRYGFYSRNVPSYFMGHQLRILNPLGNGILENGTEIYNKFFLYRYAGVLVPDFEEDGLTGRLAHDLSIIDERRLNYVGPLSEFHYRPTTEDVDVFVSISGPEPQRSSFERLVSKQLEDFSGKVVTTLGKPEDNGDSRSNQKSYLSRNDREELLNRSRIVIARSGYSTLMDLYSIRKRGFLIPTPGQIEQEYLAKYHMSRRTYYCVSERDLDIPRQLGEALALSPPTLNYSSEKTVARVMDLITQTAKFESAQIRSFR
jgi:hypothetical protein